MAAILGPVSAVVMEHDFSGTVLTRNSSSPGSMKCFFDVCKGKGTSNFCGESCSSLSSTQPVAQACHLVYKCEWLIDCCQTGKRSVGIYWHVIIPRRRTLDCTLLLLALCVFYSYLILDISFCNSKLTFLFDFLFFNLLVWKPFQSYNNIFWCNLIGAALFYSSGQNVTLKKNFVVIFLFVLRIDWFNLCEVCRGKSWIITQSICIFNLIPFLLNKKSMNICWFYSTLIKKVSFDELINEMTILSSVSTLTQANKQRIRIQKINL